MTYILLGEGFEEIEALAPCDILRRGGEEVALVGIGGKTICGGHGIAVTADLTVEEMDLAAMDLLVLPGGMGGVRSIEGSKAATTAIRYAAEHGKKIGAICAAPTILGKLGLLRGKTAVCYPGMEAELFGAKVQNAPVTVDGAIICSRAAGSAIPFGLALLSALRGKDAAEAVRKGIVFDG